MRKLSTKKKIKKSKGKNDESVLPDSNENIDEDSEANENGGKSDSSADDADDEKEKAPKRKNKEKSDDDDQASVSGDEAEETKSEASANGADEEEYEVQEVVDHKIEKGISYYLIRWKGYDADGDTWEPEDTLSCPDLISKFKKRGKRSSDKKGNAKKKAKTESKEKSPVDPDKEWEVEKVVDVANDKKGGRIFRIRWKGYRPASDTWEPEEHLNCKDLIEKFLKKQDDLSDLAKKDLREEPKRTQRFATDSFGRRASKRNSGRTRTVYYDAE